MNNSNPIPTPRFTGIFIPAEILAHPDLTSHEQILISWIDALYCEEHGGCFASNEYLASRLKVKVNTITKSLTRLRKLGLIDMVSFNGRIRVMRAKIHDFVGKSQSKSALDLNPGQQWIKIQGSTGFLSNALNIEKKAYIKEEITPPTSSPLAADAAAAIAAVGDVPSPLQPKKPKAARIFSPQVKEVSDKMLTILAACHPVYRPPDKIDKFHEEVEVMVEKEKQDVEVLLKTFQWACSDSEQRGDFKGWQSVVCRNVSKGKPSNPAAIFRKNFDVIYAQMKAKVPRKFSPSSDDERSLAKWMAKESI